MAGYREKSKEFELDVTNQGVTARRVFIWDINGSPNSNETLPEMGDKLPKTLSEGVDQGIYVSKRRKTFADGNPLIALWEISYTTIDQGSNEFSLEELNRSVSIGGEFLNIGQPDGTYRTWESDGADIEQDIYKRIVTMSFKVPKIFGTVNGISAKIMDYVGKVNSAEFYGFPAGNVLFNGASGQEFKNSKGFKRWRVEYDFEFRAPILNDGSMGTWQHIWREDKSDFDTTDPLIYDTADFSGLLIGGGL